VVKNELYECAIEDITSDGDGVAHVGGIAVFIKTAAVGDVCRIKILKVKNGYAYGKIEDILTESQARISVDCPCFGRCGACTFRHISYEEELRIKRKIVCDALSRIGHLDTTVGEIIPSPKLNGYRQKAVLPVDVDGNVGCYARHSHRVVACGDCKLYPPDIINAIDDVTAKNDLKNLKAKHVFVRSSAANGQIFKALVTAKKPNFPVESIDALNINESRNNVIFGKKWVPITENQIITERICRLDFHISPASFFQVNPAAAELVYGKAIEYAALDGTQNVLDLYCGVGTISLIAAGRAKSVTGIEIVPQAVKMARANAELNGIANAEFHCTDASKIPDGNYDVVFVDPIRAGLSADTVVNILRLNPKKIIYVSCKPSTFARDCANFAKAGYKLREVTPVDMFPRTAHVECVGVMTKG
jgi:23S rRNA (uracil-5-)-methyltransferase RumA